LASVEALRDAGIARDLKPEQRTALLHIGTSEHRVVAVHGVAGSGKSTIIGALREAVGEQTTLIALAPTSSAASELGQKANIDHAQSPVCLPREEPNWMIAMSSWSMRRVS
jgi:putative protein kinase ArgK-like GTPase of G3E family